MGKKGKVGKSRRDRFYHLAKETGYRSRAAFKLIQLNRKYEFLQKSNVIVDLCAAPGGWLQVVAENAPMSNHIIGIDLDPITPIKNVKTLQEDITTEKCRQALRKQLHTVKADIFLNDGAPNLGKNWIHDAYQQAELTLHALKLATEFLRKGGWFVTKLFRSKDYDSLMWVFQQLFKTVEATKPQASRNESAEIFVVCQNYNAPDKIDPKFLNPKYAFSEVGGEKKLAIDLIHPAKKRRQREGYPEGDYTLFHSLSATEFLASPDFMDLLAESSEIKLDAEEIENHPLTTTEIKECLKDIKLLGKKEIKSLFTWRRKLKSSFEESAENNADETDETEADTEKRGEDDEDGDGEDLKEAEKDLAELEKLVEEKNLQELKAMKKVKKKVKKAQMKQKTRIDLKMAIPGDRIDIQGDISIFNIQRIKNKGQMREVDKGDMSLMDGKDMYEDDSDDDKPRQKKIFFDREEKKYVGVGEDTDDEANEEDMEEEPTFDNDDVYIGEESEEDDNHHDDQSKSEEEGEEENAENINPLLVDMGVKDRVMKDNESSWFSKSAFADLEKDADEDVELGQMGLVDDERKGRKKKKDKFEKAIVGDSDSDSEGDDDNDDGDDDEDESDSENDDVAQDDNTKDADLGDSTPSKPDDNDDDDDDDDTDSDDDSDGEDSDYDYMQANSLSKWKKGEKGRGGPVQSKATGDRKTKVTKFNGIEVVPVTADPALQLDEEGLAIGAAMAQSRKRRREIIESGYHRYMYDDEDLPEWFAKDDKKHTIRQMPITKEEVEEYRLKAKAIDAQPIKKIAEAKARKKKKTLKSLEKARKKANAITDTMDVSEKEKWNQIKHVYKKAGLLNKVKEKVTYVRAKKGTGKKVSRPAGVKGKFKVVDGRMKKDLLGQKKAEMRKQKGSKSGKKQGRKNSGNKRVRR